MLRLFPLAFVLVLVQASLSAAQNDPCDPRALLRPSDPVSPGAIKLTKTPTGHGISVRCVLRSKEARMFEGQLGAAFFRTDIGDFEALFLPRPKTWDQLEVVEQSEHSGYTKYNFRGLPRSSGTWEGKPVYFVKNGDQLLHAQDQKTVSKLREVLKRE